MISTFLVEYSAFVPWAMLVVALVCVGLGQVFVRRQPGRSALRILTGLAVVPAVALTLLPDSREVDGGCVVAFAAPQWGAVESLANLALLFPFVLFLALALRRAFLALVAGTALSAVIETVQALVPALGRSCDTNDWWMNTLGAGVAALLAAGLLRSAGPRRAAAEARRSRSRST